jgi:quercetin dioxygenase-like cupin family protein
MKITVRERAKFAADKMAKIALATTARAQLDLYCLEPGQSQKPHVHADQDKIYYVVEGRGRFVLGEAEHQLSAGVAIVAAAGAAHGVVNDSDARLLLLVVVSPPPPHA